MQVSGKSSPGSGKSPCKGPGAGELMWPKTVLRRKRQGLRAGDGYGWGGRGRTGVDLGFYSTWETHSHSDVLWLQG